MITATIIARQTLEIRAVVDITTYSIEKDIEFNGSSSIEVYQGLNVQEEDFIMIREYSNIIALGIVTTIENPSGTNRHVIHFSEIESMFDRDIFLDGEYFVHEIGVEDFIAQCIFSNYVFHDYDFINHKYLDIDVTTHTPIVAKVDNENGIFNLKTYMANVSEKYGIGYTFTFKRTRLVIEIAKRDDSPLKINTEYSDIVNYSEVYETDVIAKLTAKWKQPDVTNTDEEGNESTIIGETSIHDYYLLTDRTVSTDKNNPKRASGKIVTEYFELETYEELLEEVTQRFRSNTYSHSVEADVYRNSRIYPVEQLFVGKECEIKTRSRGVKQSIITRLAYSNKSQYVSIKFGKMKITLLEKLRRERGNG